MTEILCRRRATSKPKPVKKRHVVGVMGGAFNPIHSGHVLLAVTVRETQPVDEVVIVPVFKHPVKSDLLPFHDRAEMCRLAAVGTGVRVSTCEERIGESNAAMLRALKEEYSDRKEGVELVWICGDDVFDWIDNPKGQDMLKEIGGMIVQRRLCRAGDSAECFDSSPANPARIEEMRVKHGIRVDVMDGKLPHLSSSLVRSSPALWRAYLPQLVAFYLDERPQLLFTLVGEVPRRPQGISWSYHDNRSTSSDEESSVSSAESGGASTPLAEQETCCGSNATTASERTALGGLLSGVEARSRLFERMISHVLPEGWRKRHRHHHHHNHHHRSHHHDKAEEHANEQVINGCNEFVPHATPDVPASH